MIFKATFDTAAKVVTIGITILFIAIAVGPQLVNKSANNSAPILISLLLFTIYGIAYIFSPKYYEITESSIVIKRPFKSISINRDTIKNLLVLENGNEIAAIRTFGVGGLFGYFGKFWNKQFGNMTWYATRRNKAIMIITLSNQKIVITPDDVETFVSTFKKM